MSYSKFTCSILFTLLLVFRLNDLVIAGIRVTTITANSTDFSAVQPLEVNSTAQVITFDPLPAKAYGNAPFTLTATASSGLDVSYTSSNPSVATVVGNTVTIVGVGTTNIIASQAGDATYSAATNVVRQLVVGKASQTITFDALPTKTYGDASFSLDATSSSGLPVSFVSSNPGIANITSNVVTIVGAGNVNITAVQTGNGIYAPATTVVQQLVINKADQTITFTALPAKIYGNAPFNLTATSSSGLLVSYITSDPLVATISGSMVTIKGVGTVNITAAQIGNNNYNPATVVLQPLVVGKAEQTINNFNPIIPRTYGISPFTIGGSASSGLTLTFTSSNLAVATITGNTVTIVGVGTTDITASQAGNANYNEAVPVVQTLVVNKANQTITFSLLAPKTYGDADFDVTATASSKLAVTFTSSNPSVATVTGNTVTILKAGFTDIIAHQAGNDNYNAAISVIRSLQINKISQIITVEPIADKLVDDAPFDVIATVSTGFPLTYTIVSGPATIKGNKITLDGTEGLVTVKVMQAGDENYETVSVTEQFNVTLTTDIFGAQKTEKVTVYPNPVHRTTAVYLPVASETYRLTLYNSKGEIVYETMAKGEKELIDCSSMASGIYYVTLSNAANRYHGKIVLSE